jgi:hypothetical protein
MKKLRSVDLIASNQEDRQLPPPPYHEDVGEWRWSSKFLISTLGGGD